MNLRIFISSVQKEFAEERRLLKRYIAMNPAYRRFFDTFVFEEDVVAADRRTDEVYLEELGKCDIYLGLIGREYGFEDTEGVSPTEREFDEATRLGLTRLLFVLDNDGGKRHPKEAAFLKKISTSLIRAKCSDPAQLLLEIYASLDGMLVERGAYRMGPFDASPCDGATMADIDEDKVRWFVKRARQERNVIVIHRRNGTNSIKLPEGSLKSSLKGSLKSSLKILEILAADSHCTYDVLAERLGISRRAVTKQISNLRKEGKLRRIGPDKGGHWEVIDGK